MAPGSRPSVLLLSNRSRTRLRDHLKKPTVDATAMEQRITDELTGSEFLKAASNVDYAALMGVLDNHMSCIKAVCPKEYDAVMSQIHALR